jgi:hypothetical protein
VVVGLAVPRLDPHPSHEAKERRLGTRQIKSKVKTNFQNNFRINFESHVTPELKSEVNAKFKNDARAYTSGRAY